MRYKTKFLLSYVLFVMTRIEIQSYVCIDVNITIVIIIITIVIIIMSRSN